MQQLQPRREVWEHGFLPLHSLCPQIDSLPALQALHAKLLQCGHATPSGQWVITTKEVGSLMELTATQLEILCEVLRALSVLNGSNAQPEQVSLHELSMFMFAQLFSKETQRQDNLEVWPETGPGTSGVGMSLGLDGLLSPTRAMTVRTSMSGKASIRQQLHQILRHQAQQLRAYGEYLKRNLRTLIDLAADGTPAAEAHANAPNNNSTGPTTSGTPATAGLTPATSQRLVTAKEVDRLRFVLHVSNIPRQAPGCLASLLPGLRPPGAALPVDAVVTALKQCWLMEDIPQSPRIGGGSPASNMLLSPTVSNSRANRQLGIVAPAGTVDDTSITGVSKGTVVRGETDLPQGMLRVTDCHDAMIYVLAPLQCAYISVCSESTIIIGAAGSMVRLERCEKVTLIAAAARVVVSNCHDCTLYLGTPTSPVLIGDCRFVKLAPFNTRYERQLAHVAAVGLRLDVPNKWDTPLVLTAKDRRQAISSGGTPDSPRAGASNKSLLSSTTFSLLQPDELLPFVIPFQGGPGSLAGGAAASNTTNWKQIAGRLGGGGSDGGNHVSSEGAAHPQAAGQPLVYLFPLPPEYERALHRKLAMTTEMRHRFKQAALAKERENDLNNAIQAHFREWLQNSNLLRQIYDLSNLEKDEGQVAGWGSADTVMTFANSSAQQLQQPPFRDRTTLSL